MHDMVNSHNHQPCTWHYHPHCCPCHVVPTYWNKTSHPTSWNMIAYQDRKRDYGLHSPPKARGTCFQPFRIVEIDWQPNQGHAVFAAWFHFGDALKCVVAMQGVERRWIWFNSSPYCGYGRIQITYINTPDTLEAWIRVPVFWIIVSLIIASTQGAKSIKQ